MTGNDFRSLCARREGPQLDFKDRFYENSDAGNTELAKDIMAIANTLTAGAEGHILVGVQEAADGIGEIRGCTLAPWITDSNLQQKVRGYLNRAPPFSIHTLRVDELDVLAIKIGAGARPFFPLRDKGVLKRNIAVVRIGSSTDIASPDEMLSWARQDEALDLRSLEAERLRAEKAIEVSIRKEGSGMVGADQIVDCAIRNLGEKPIRIAGSSATWRYSDELAKALTDTWPKALVPLQTAREAVTVARMDGAQPGEDAIVRVVLQSSPAEISAVSSRPRSAQPLPMFQVDVTVHCENMAGVARTFTAKISF